VIRVSLPQHLRELAGVGADLEVEIDGQPTIGSLLDAIERDYPMLRGTIRDPLSRTRRPMLRFFACRKDLSLETPHTRLPEAVASGQEAFIIIGAIAGG